MRILKFNEDIESDEIFEYIKLCFIDLSDVIGIQNDEYDDGGINYHYNEDDDIYVVSIDKYEEDKHGGSFDRFYMFAEKEFEYIKNIKDAIDKVRIKYTNCIIDMYNHEYYEIMFDMKMYRNTK